MGKGLVRRAPTPNKDSEVKMRDETIHKKPLQGSGCPATCTDSENAQPHQHENVHQALRLTQILGRNCNKPYEQPHTHKKYPKYSFSCILILQKSMEIAQPHQVLTLNRYVSAMM